MRKQTKFVAAALLLLLVVTACSPAPVEPTVIALLTDPPQPAVNEPAPADADNHSHAADEPDHIHLDDNVTMSPEGLAPLREDVFALLIAGDPIPVGQANESMETAVLTIPTMF